MIVDHVSGFSQTHKLTPTAEEINGERVFIKQDSETGTYYKIDAYNNMQAFDNDGLLYDSFLYLSEQIQQ